MKKILIAGLGNPGEKYKNTPHNIGFEVLNRIIETLKSNDDPVKEKHIREVAIYEFKSGKTKLILLKPLLYMNRSGIVVKDAVETQKINSKESLWVIHDDMDIDIGTIKVKKGGISAGHKGIESIIENVNTNNFWRFKVGIKPKNTPAKRSPEFMEKFVTKKLSKVELKKMSKSIEMCTNLVLESIEKEIKNIKISFT